MEPVNTKPETPQQLGDPSHGVTSSHGYNKNVPTNITSQKIPTVSFSEKDKFKVKHFPIPKFKKTVKCPDDFKIPFETVYLASALSNQDGKQKNTKLNIHKSSMTLEDIQLMKDKRVDKFRLSMEFINECKARYRWGDAAISTNPNDYYSRGRQLVRPIAGDTNSGIMQAGYINPLGLYSTYNVPIASRLDVR